MANTGEAARQLYQAIRELNQLKIDPLLRFKMLEIVRPYIYSISSLLSKHILQASIALNDRQVKIANLTQSLQGHLTTGYKLVVVGSLATLNANQKPSRIVTSAIHRAITDAGATILRAFQLYGQPPEHTWREINQLYLLAETHNLTHFNVSDAQNTYLSTSNIPAAFIRIHLLASAKPNNLRQLDLAQLYDAIELWVDRVFITEEDDEDALFLIDFSQNKSAQYRQAKPRDNNQPLRSLNVSALVHELKSYAANPQGNCSITVPGKLSDNLLAHAIQSWGIHWHRAFRRLPSSNNLTLCIGLSAVHYYTSGCIDFNRWQQRLQPDILQGTRNLQADTGSRTKGDVWSQAFDVEETFSAENEGTALDSIEFLSGNKEDSTISIETQEIKKYPTYDIKLINTSPGGYCLEWIGEIPASIQAGEVLGLQEADIDQWAIGVIRWIKYRHGKSMQIGLELLAPKAEAGASRLLQKTGDNGPYLRSLLLPEIKSMSQPSTLILPRMPFRTGNKIEVQHDDIQGRYQLSKRLLSTNSFSQFQLREDAHKKNQHSNIQYQSSTDDDFDSLWEKL